MLAVDAARSLITGAGRDSLLLEHGRHGAPRQAHERHLIGAVRQPRNVHAQEAGTSYHR
jgi:hypothetical protein